jgi:hypothetical protein
MQPLAFLDVDGVFNVFAAPSSASHLLRQRLDLGVGRFNVKLDSAHAAMVKRLADANFELTWGTTWEDYANTYLLGHLGLPGPLPVVAFEAEMKLPPPELLPPSKFSYRPYCIKAPSVIRYAGDRPFVWFDDDFLPEDHDWAEARNAAGQPTLLLDIDPVCGLQDSHVDRALEWQGQLSQAL